ncbi:MAG: ATP-binding cassette domain-containing protein [Candidatus Woesearchaeota archaeon]
MNNILRIENLSVYLANEKKNIIKNLNLEIKQGEINLLIGPNGSGKTTLLFSILNHPNYIKEGKILLNDENITNWETEKIAEKIAVSWQNPLEFENISIRQLLWTVAQRNYNAIEFKNKLNEYLKLFNFTEQDLSRTHGFSGGERKRIELMLCMFQKPMFLLLDEIDSGIDIENIKIFANVINSLKGDCGVLVISHFSKMLQYLDIDKVHLFINGQILKSDSKELLDEIEKNGFKN